MSTEHKAVLLSIRPEWCVKILNGEKTVEIRKNRPKLKPPFKCYIYCTKAPKKLITIFRDGDVFGDGEVYRGKPQFVTWDGVAIFQSKSDRKNRPLSPSSSATK